MQISETQINDILNNADIEGLLVSGAPVDEYESEASLIYQSILEMKDRVLTREEIILIVSQVWQSSFELLDQDMVERHNGVVSVSDHIYRLYDRS